MNKDLMISDLILTLQKVKDKFGDLVIVGNVREDVPLTEVAVIDDNGCECWPEGNPDRTPSAVWLQ